MRKTERGVAVAHRVCDNSHREQIVNLVESFVLCKHFSVYRIKMLRSAVYGAVNAYFRKAGFERAFNLCNKLLALLAFLVNSFNNFVIRNGVEVSKRIILKFPFYFIHTESVRKRCVNV